MREWVLAVLLALAGASVVVGVAGVSTSAAWIVAGLLGAGLAWLMLGEVGG